MEEHGTFIELLSININIVMFHSYVKSPTGS
jgi:hypothetical protein